jgi:hypothetical protein
MDPNMIQYRQDPIDQFCQVTANWSSFSIHANICLGWTIEQTLNALFITMATHVDFSQFLDSSFMIGKVDMKCPGMQTWMDSENFLYEYEILDGVYNYIILGCINN